MTKWIQCDGIKGMPRDQQFLVYGDLYPNAVGSVRKGVVQLVILDDNDYEEENQGFTVTGDVQYGAKMWNVTHWMPAPGRPRQHNKS